MILTGAARLAGVMGWPVRHSRSPRLHGWWLEQYQIDGAYLPLPVPPEGLVQALRALPLLGFAGTNVTIPHKEAVLAAVDEADPLARRIGAVNTVVVRSDGSLFGSNTDAFGLVESLREGAPEWNPGAGPAVVLGAGGAARAACVALIDAGAPMLRVVNRSGERARTLAGALAGTVGIEVAGWRHRHLALADAALLVNATALGMSGGAPLELDLDALPGSALVADIVYTPLETPLLAAARRRGNRVVDGLGMLLHQARPGFAAWFGVEPAVTPALRDFMLADLQ